MLSHLRELSEDESAAGADDEEDCDPTAEEAGDSAAADGVAGSSASGGAGLDVVGRRWRGQCKPGWIKASASSQLKRIHTMADGTTVFTDELERMEDTARKAEKRRAAEEAKKRKEEEAKRKADEDAAAAAATPTTLSPSLKPTASASAPSPAKPFMFEVVIPFAAKPAVAAKGASSATAAAVAERPSSASSATSSALRSASTSPVALKPATKDSKSVPALTLDDFVSPGAPVLNAWGTGVMPAAAPVKKSVIPVTAKSKPGAAYPVEEEAWGPVPAAARSREEIEAGRAAKAALKQARREARERIAADAAEAEARVQAELEARAAAELMEEDAAAEAARALEAAQTTKVAARIRRKRSERKESDSKPPLPPSEPTAAADAEVEPGSDEDAATSAAAESDSELEALNQPGAAAESFSASPAVSTPVLSSRALAPAVTAAPLKIESRSLLHLHPSSAPPSAATSPDRLTGVAASSGSPLRAASLPPRTLVTASPMRASTSPKQRQALADIIRSSASPHSASSSSSAPRVTPTQPSVASLAAAQLAWQRQQIERTALRMIPFAQMQMHAAAAVTPAAMSKPSPTPVAAPLSSPTVSVRPTAIALVDSIVTSSGGDPTSILLVRRLPSSVSSELLGSLFCCFGRLRVQLLVTLSADPNSAAGGVGGGAVGLTADSAAGAAAGAAGGSAGLTADSAVGAAGTTAGLSGVLHFHSSEAAQAARRTMGGRVYDLTTTRENSPNQTQTTQRWSLSPDDLVFAHSPLTTRSAPPTVVKLMGYSRVQCAADFNRQNAAAAGSNAHAQSMFMFA